MPEVPIILSNNPPTEDEIREMETTDVGGDILVPGVPAILSNNPPAENEIYEMEKTAAANTADAMQVDSNDSELYIASRIWACILIF